MGLPNVQDIQPFNMLVDDHLCCSFYIFQQTGVFESSIFNREVNSREISAF